MTDPDEAPNFEGHEGRECGEHRTLGPHRAWCHDCAEYCYPDSPCARCELPRLRVERDAAYAVIRRLVKPPVWQADLVAVAWCRPWDSGTAAELMTAAEAEAIARARADQPVPDMAREFHEPWDEPVPDTGAET